MSFTKMSIALVGVACSAIAALAGTSFAQGQDTPEEPSAKTFANACALLDDPAQRAMMGALELRLLIQCGRAGELGQVRSAPRDGHGANTDALGMDVLVNDPALDSGASQTQNSTTLAVSETTGTLCSGYNDSYAGVVLDQGYVGHARSTDGGATFSDRGSLDNRSYGEPSVVWRKLDGNFYLASIASTGIGLWRSTDDCQSFQFLAVAHAGADDREFLAVDDNAASPYYGRLYLAWNIGNGVYATYSDNVTTWSAPLLLSPPGALANAAWPTVAPDGSVYVTWLLYNGSYTGLIDVEMARSTNGGASFPRVTNPMTGKTNPYDETASNSCVGPALNGNVRYVPGPQVAISPNGDVHVVYSYDPDTHDAGDVVNVYYRRSIDQGTSWQTEVQLNDDGTTRDQYYPTVSAGPSGRIVASWYDRRLDPNNLLVDYYSRTSDDGGANWSPSQRVSDVSSPIYFDPAFITCYHGYYDQQLQRASDAYLQWSDDRAVRSGHNDPDVYLDRHTLAPDFAITPTPATQSVCAPASGRFDLTIESLNGFVHPVILSATGNPAGTTTSFTVNPVVPTGNSALSVDNTGAATPGTYVLELTGTSFGMLHKVHPSLSIATAAPAPVTLLSPADGGTLAPIAPVFTWNPTAQAVSYVIEIASDAPFTHIVDAATVTDTSYQTPIALSTHTTYYWRVHAANVCGESSSSPVYTFKVAMGVAIVVCFNPALAIPDNSPAGIDDSRAPAASGTIFDLNLSLQVHHTWVGDLAFKLTHVDTGTAVTFIDRPGYPGTANGCDKDNIDATLDDQAVVPVETACSPTPPAISGTFTPNNPLSVFTGEDLSGTWTLNASDHATADVGTLDQWCLLPTVDASAVDSDGDGVMDDQDNCTQVPNPSQHDSDGDGFGNPCDGDFNNDCASNFLDLGIMKTNFFAVGDLATDMNEDLATNFLDLGALKTEFFQPPGPSAVATCPLGQVRQPGQSRHAGRTRSIAAGAIE